MVSVDPKARRPAGKFILTGIRRQMKPWVSRIETCFGLFYLETAVKTAGFKGRGKKLFLRPQ